MCGITRLLTDEMKNVSIGMNIDIQLNSSDDNIIYLFRSTYPLLNIIVEK